MPSVLGLLEAREKKVREEVARLQQEAERVRAALVEAESRLAGARVTVAEVLAEPPAVVGEPVASAVTGSVVPRRAVLPPDYQRIVSVLESEAGRGMRCQQLATALGLQAVPAKVEGLRSKAKRLVERGWALEVRPGVFTPSGTPAG
ncbi:hypothetical protein H3146_04350 [Streptomyces sp. OF3]|uniref:Uncharacterized protein n=1 Tax=Streptomyces alkaliterrae TaxID=2213162 RepID=A0A7W3WHU5_9ACTN|nr:hypothetical protein [Streptomyces alkaliterrae]MBB1252604.1 hypothetical protein [Streptomyces alkaliterrae]